MKTITILCNAGLLHLAGNSDLTPIKCSKPLNWLDECVFAAEFDEERLEKLTDEQCEAGGAWWREISRSNVDWEDAPLPTIGFLQGLKLTGGMFSWITSQFGASQPRNVAAIVGDIAQMNGITAIELLNQLSP